MSKSNMDGNTQRSEQATRDELVASELVPRAARQKKAPSPRKCRDFIRRETANAMPDIVDRFVGHAKGGSVPHFNALTKVGGFDQRPSSSEVPKRRRKSLGRQLLDEVEKYEAKQAAELAAANAQTDNGGPQERS